MKEIYFYNLRDWIKFTPRLRVCYTGAWQNKIYSVKSVILQLFFFEFKLI